MLQYDHVHDQYIEVDFDEFSDSDNNEEEDSPTATVRSLNPLLVLKRKRRTSKSRSSFINYFNLTRVVRKSGRLNTFLTKLPNKSITFIRDLGYTLLNLQWRWILLTLCLVNFVCFVLFSGLWRLLAEISGDFETNAKEQCVMNAKTFTGYLLLSIETITTIGYGLRYPTEACRGGWFLLMLQGMFSIAVQGVLVSAVYVKTSKPFTRSVSSSLFSKNAVICLRDGKLRFVFRIHDFSRKIWCGTNISLYFIDKEPIHLEDDFEMIQMETEPHGLLIFPLEIEHVIEENSPLWKFRPLEILQTRFEIVAVAEGSSTITGQVSQNRTSYSNTDIMWGHRFKPCVDYDEKHGRYVVNYKKFKQTVPFDTPLCSARKLEELQKRNAYLLEMEKKEAASHSKETVENRRKLETIKESTEEERIPQVFYKLFHKESVADFTKLNNNT